MPMEFNLGFITTFKCKSDYNSDTLFLSDTITDSFNDIFP